MMKMMGSDGIERDLDEHYDCISDVKEDPTGARQAIQDLWAEIERLRVELRHCINELRSDTSRAPHRIRRAALAEKVLHKKEPAK